MKPVIFSHGEKGGVGKSTVAALMCDALIFRGEKRIAIVDGDGTTDDVTRRYGAHAASSAIIGLADPSEKERAINKLVDYIEQVHLDVDAIVVNLPATASETVDPEAEIIRQTLEDLDLEPRIVYSASNNTVAFEALKQSFEDGLARACEKRLALAPAFLRDDGLLERLQKVVPDAAEFERLPADTYALIQQHATIPMYHLALGNHPDSLKSPIQRIRISGWTQRGIKTLAPVLEDVMGAYGRHTAAAQQAAREPVRAA